MPIAMIGSGLAARVKASRARPRASEAGPAMISRLCQRVAAAATRWHSLLILAGPTSLTLGLAVLAFTLAASPLPIIAIGMVLIGLGFGLSYAFLTQRVMATADPGEEDATIASMSTLFGMGGAVSAAVSGLIGNSIGLDGTLDVGGVS